MSREPMPPAPSAPPRPALPPEPEHLAPIVPLDAVRRRRAQPPPRPGSLGPAERDARQREVLSQAVASGRLGSADLFAMVRLGILTDDIAMLPCADRHRRYNALDWERRYVEARGDVGPDHPTASQVGCPLMARAASAAPPACVEALRHRAQIPVWHPVEGFQRQPLDEEDPVVAADVRPCVLLSRELFRHTLLPLWQEEPG